MVLAGKLNTDVVAALVAGGVSAVGLSGVDGRLLLARKQEGSGLGFVGEVVQVKAEVLATLLERVFLPVVASIAVDEHGQAYNVNADVVAAELALELDAEKLVYVSDVPGLIGPTGDLLWELSASPGQRLRHARRGRRRDGPEAGERGTCARGRRRPGAPGRRSGGARGVLELFTPEGIGTMITPDIGRITP